MISLARESRGLALNDLALKVDLHKSSLSRFEREGLTPNDATMEKIAKELGYLVDFFYQEGESLPLRFSYRKRDVVPQRVMDTLEANINVYRLNMERLLSAIGYKETKVPRIEIGEFSTPAGCAKELRRRWKLPKGPIDNLSGVLEDHGILLLRCDFGTDRVDGRSILAADKFPIIITNKNLLGDRLRFTLAYQLAHLVMHQNIFMEEGRDLSHEANLFAAELLMPQEQIMADLQELSLPKLAALKPKWKVSMQSLIYRANDLGLLTDNQQRYLLQQFNENNIRRREPKELDVPVEKYRLVRDLLTGYKTKQRMNSIKLAAFLYLNHEEFERRYEF